MIDLRACLVVLCLMVSPALAEGDGQAAIDAVESAMVRVGYVLQYDKGEAPYGGEWTYRFANCSRLHVRDLEEYIDQERSAERVGFMISPTEVLTSDVLINPRFIKRIEVTAGDTLVAAVPVAYATDRNAVVLRLDEAMTDRSPLVFDGDAAGPYFAVHAVEQDGSWTTTAAPFQPKVSRRGNGQQFIAAPTDALIVNEGGEVVTAVMREDLPVGEGWKVAPTLWPMIDADEHGLLLQRLREQCGRRIVRVRLGFRSPKRGDGGMGGFRDFEEEMPTERNVVGVLLDEQRLLVLESLEPKITARLEQIQVFPLDGAPVDANFVGSLRHYGAFVADLDAPVSIELPGRSLDILDHRHELLLALEVRVQGENRIAYAGRGRIPGFEVGWRHQVYPQVSGPSENRFLFDRQCALVAVPVVRRKQVAMEERWETRRPKLTAMEYLWSAVDDLGANIDPDNAPLSEANENRLAWLGVELQALDQDLARLHGVSDQTSDGQSGALIIYVYPDSPAAQCGLEVGDLLLRLHADGQPRPLEVTVDEDPYGFGMSGYPWEHWDELPEELFDQIPPPWPTAENRINRQLTDLGFGTAIACETVRDGEMIDRTLTVAKGPAHYAGASKHKADDLGLTVRDLTYEVRRYFQIPDGEPGVILSRIEPGSKAAVAGLRPYELILSVDEQPVHSAEEFGAAMATPGERRLSVKRMAEGRIVKVKTE